MKIIYHHRTQCNNAEGVHIRETVHALRRLRNEVFVVSPPGINPFEDKHAAESKKVEDNILWMIISKCMPAIGFEILEIGYNFVGYRNIKKLFKKQKVNFVYERYSFFGCAGMLCAKHFKIPFILEVNFTTYTPLFRKKSQILSSLARYIEKKVFSHADAVFVVSSFLKKCLIESGIPKSKIYLTPNAVSEKVFDEDYSANIIRQKFKLNGKKVIGFVGGFYPWHGLDFLLKAISNVERKINNICLFLIGEGPERETLKQMSKKLKICTELIFPGSVAYVELPKYIKAMDICVMPGSNNYGSPMKIFEYMAMGKPVVAPRLAPIEDVINDNVNGMLFQQNDSSSLEGCLLELINNDEKRKRIGQEARKTVFLRHLWKHNAEKVIQAYNEIK